MPTQPMTTADDGDDDHRYSCFHNVMDADGRPGLLRIGIENGRVIGSSPTEWSADPDTAELISEDMRSAGNQAELQRWRGEQS